MTNRDDLVASRPNKLSPCTTKHSFKIAGAQCGDKLFIRFHIAKAEHTDACGLNFLLFFGFG